MYKIKEYGGYAIVITSYNGSGEIIEVEIPYVGTNVKALEEKLEDLKSEWSAAHFDISESDEYGNYNVYAKHGHSFSSVEIIETELIF